MARRAFLIACIAMTVSIGAIASAAQAQTEALKPTAPGWDIGKISKGKDISGIACVKLGADKQGCIIAVDEEASAAFVTIQGKTIKQNDKIRLAPEKDDEEFDAEGAAYDPQTKSFYVIGSHGKSRHECRANPSSFRLVRIPIDAATGRPTFDYKKNLADPAWVAPEVEVAKDIKPAMLASTKIGPHVDKCLGTKPSKKKKGDFAHEQGANVEGFAILGTRAFVGFRGPVIGGTAFLLAFDRDALFTSGTPTATTIEIALGAGMGIRDLAPVADGLLVLSGPEDDDPGKAAIHYFHAASGKVTPLGLVPDPQHDGKPEALLLLDETDAAYRVLVMSDSADNGDPTEFVVAKKK